MPRTGSRSSYMRRNPAIAPRTSGVPPERALVPFCCNATNPHFVGRDLDAERNSMHADGNGNRRRTAVLLLIFLLVTCMAAEEGVLVLVVTDTGQHPFPNVRI